MGRKVQFRGGTTLEHTSFIGGIREVTVDTTKKVVVVHDGATYGGIPMASESSANALGGRLDVIEGDSTTVGSISKAINDAINTLRDGVDIDLDTLKELSDALAANENTAAVELANAISDLRTELRSTAGASMDTFAEVETAINSLISSLGIEATTRIDADTALGVRIDTEKGRVDVLNSNNTVAGSVAKQVADAVNAEVTARNSAIAVEANTRATDISSEAGAREAADVVLNTAITGNTSRLNLIEGSDVTVGSFKEAVKTAIDTEVEDRDTAIASEATLRANADATEASTRANADTALGVRIDTEKGRVDVLNGDNTIVGSVAKQVADAVNTLKDGVSIDLDTLAELATALNDTSNDAATNLANAIADLRAELVSTAGTSMDTFAEVEVAITALNTDLAAEASARFNADDALNIEIVNAKTRLNTIQGSDTTTGSIAEQVKTAVDAEANARAAAVNAEISNRTDAVNTEISDRVAAINNEASLRSDADATEASTRANADTALGVRIDTEKGRVDVLNGDNTIVGSVAKQVADAITTEVSNRNDAIASEALARTNADNAEAGARINADTALDDKITVEKNRIDAIILHEDYGSIV